MNELVELLSEKLGVACDYVEANISEVIAQYTSYKITMAVIDIVIGAVLWGGLVTFCLLLLRARGKCKLRKEDNWAYEYYQFSNEVNIKDVAIVIAIIYGIVTLLLGTICLASGIEDAIGWSKAPIMMLIKTLKG